MSKYTEPCPVCGKTMQCEAFYEPRWLEEEYKSCPDGHYHYDYAYGNTKITVGEKEFGGWYGDSPQKWRELDRQVQEAINQIKLKENACQN